MDHPLRYTTWDEFPPYSEKNRISPFPVTTGRRGAHQVPTETLGLALVRTAVSDLHHRPEGDMNALALELSTHRSSALPHESSVEATSC